MLDSQVQNSTTSEPAVEASHIGDGGVESKHVPEQIPQQSLVHERLVREQTPEHDLPEQCIFTAKHAFRGEY